MRAERGKHIIYFEDGDSGPALRALTPFLSWGTDDGTDTLPYAEFFDIAGRALRVASAGARGTAFHQRQISAVPLTRSWHLLLPGLGLVAAEDVPARTAAYSRRSLLLAVRERLKVLTAEELDTLVVDDAEWLDRLAPTSAARAIRAGSVSRPGGSALSWLPSSQLQAVG